MGYETLSIESLKLMRKEVDYTIQQMISNQPLDESGLVSLFNKKNDLTRAIMKAQSA